MRIDEIPFAITETPGRRAVALFFEGGLYIAATDAVAGECSLRVGLMAMRGLGLHQQAEYFAPLVIDTVRSLPMQPDAVHSIHEQRRGNADPASGDSFGMTYVMPSGDDHAFGGEFVEPATGRLVEIGPAAVRLISGVPRE